MLLTGTELCTRGGWSLASCSLPGLEPNMLPHTTNTLIGYEACLVGVRAKGSYHAHMYLCGVPVQLPIALARTFGHPDTDTLDTDTPDNLECGSLSCRALGLYPACTGYSIESLVSPGRHSVGLLLDCGSHRAFAQTLVTVHTRVWLPPRVVPTLQALRRARGVWFTTPAIATRAHAHAPPRPRPRRIPRRDRSVLMGHGPRRRRSPPPHL